MNFDCEEYKVYIINSCFEIHCIWKQTCSLEKKNWIVHQAHTQMQVSSWFKFPQGVHVFFAFFYNSLTEDYKIMSHHVMEKAPNIWSKFSNMLKCMNASSIDPILMAYFKELFMNSFIIEWKFFANSQFFNNSRSEIGSKNPNKFNKITVPNQRPELPKFGAVRSKNDVNLTSFCFLNMIQ